MSQGNTSKSKANGELLEKFSEKFSKPTLKKPLEKRKEQSYKEKTNIKFSSTQPKIDNSYRSQMTGLCWVLLHSILPRALWGFGALAKRLEKVHIDLHLFQVDHQTPERTDQEDQNQLGHQEREEFQNQPIHQAQLKQDQKGTLTTQGLVLWINTFS